jgi:hypothetical protein
MTRLPQEKMTKLKEISISIHRPNEYTRWKPRVDRGIHWTTIVWGIFVVGWEW